MKGIIRNSGIDIIGKIPWGTHFCQFYKTKEDLIDVLVPYLKSGLENNEFCMWVTSEPLSAEEAKRSLGREIPNLDYYLEKGQIEIISYTEWYVIEGDFDSDRVLNGWVSKLNQALKDGYEGLRLTGNTFWLEKEGWNDFVEYEEAVDNVIGKYQMIALCTYSLDRCTAAEIIDVINNHEFALIKREGKWDIIENSEHKQTKEEAIQSKKNWEQTFNAVPDLIAILDHEHKVVRVNKAMAAKLGLDPDECVGLHCYQAVHGTDEPPYFCPHSQLLKDGCEHTSEVHEDNLGGDFIVSASPLYNSAGELMGSVHVARNINERKKAEEALKEAHDNLEEQVNERTSKLKKQADLIDLTHDAIFVRNLDDEIIFWNKGAEEMYGWKEESALGINPNELLNTEFSKPLSEIKAVVLEKGRWEGELTHEKRDGKQIIVSSRWSLQKDEKNEVTGFLEINNDITETKQAEQALKLASTYNRSLIEASVDPLVTIGPDGKITDVNGSTETITGYSRLHLIGTDFSDYFTEPEKAREGYQQVFKEGMVLDYPLEIQHRDGFITPVLYNASVYRDEDDEVIGVFAAARDVTELRKAEEELKLSYIYNRSLIEASVDPLVTIGPDGKITDVNNSTEIVTGRPREELIGTDFSDYFTEPEKAREGYTRVFQEGMVLDYPLEIMHKNGHITPVLYNASVYKDESGKVIGVFAAARDINELKKAEELLKLKINELARSNAELEQFAYVSSHDLQEPLRMIASYLQLLERKYEGKLDKKADKYIHFAVDGATRMQNLIDDLLTFSRVTTQANEFELTDIEVILNRVLTNLSVSIKENSATITHGTLPEIMVDGTQMTQVLQNLINNALKFRSKDNPKIHISASQEDKYWLFSVKDNGIGIDPKYSERIFEVFKRLHKKRDYPGTGIGLSICKKIVERHGGRIWVDSKLGEGSTFYFNIPVSNFDEEEYNET